MGEAGQTRKNITLGYVARLALAARGHHVPVEIEPEPIAQLAPTISKDDERDLLWYFAEERRNIEHAGGGSNFNAMLDRMELYTKVARACTACGGIREVVDVDGTVLVEEVGGSGTIFGSQQYRDYMRLAHIAVLKRSPQAYIQQFADGEIDCKKCVKSGGENSWPGWIIRPRKRTNREPTVKITGQIPVTVNVKTGGSESLARMGMVGRKRSRVRLVDPIAEQALESYYSPDGGDESALWWLTPMGRTLLEGNHHGLPQQAYFRAIRMAQELNHDPRVTQQFQTAERQARQLVDRMRRVWAEVNS